MAPTRRWKSLSSPEKPVYGRVLDQKGKPIEGVTVSASNWLGYRDRLRLATKTDANGKFRLTDVPIDDVLYHFYKKGYMALQDYSDGRLRLPSSLKDR